MAAYGYARVSSADQDLTGQIAKLEGAGCSVIRQEKASGTTREGRQELETLLAFLQPGDTLVVTKIDRLARSVLDLQEIVRDVRSKNAFLRATDQQIDTTTASGKCFLDMLAVFSEFETALRRERQLEGIKLAKERGVYKGRRPTIDRSEVARLKEQGFGPAAIAKLLNIGRASVYRVLGEIEGRVL